MAARHSTRARKELVHSLLQLPSDLAPSVRDSIFRFSDPMAAIVDLLDTVKFLSAQDICALFRWFSGSKGRSVAS